MDGNRGVRCIYSTERGRWQHNNCGDISGHKHSFGEDVSVGVLIVSLGSDAVCCEPGPRGS